MKHFRVEEEMRNVGFMNCRDWDKFTLVLLHAVKQFPAIGEIEHSHITIENGVKIDVQIILVPTHRASVDKDTLQLEAAFQNLDKDSIEVKITSKDDCYSSSTVWRREGLGSHISTIGEMSDDGNEWLVLSVEQVVKRMYKLVKKYILHYTVSTNARGSPNSHSMSNSY